ETIYHINNVGVFPSSGGEAIYRFPFAAYTAIGELDEEEPGLEIVGVRDGKLFIVNPLSQKELVNVSLDQYNNLQCIRNQSAIIGGGPPSIGDFDGDPSTVEIAMATGRYLTLFTSKGELLSQIETQDCSSLSTGI